MLLTQIDVMKQKAKELELSPVGKLLVQQEETITITKDMVGETFTYISRSGAGVVVEIYASACLQEPHQLLKRVAKLDGDPFQLIEDVREYLKRNHLL